MIPPMQIEGHLALARATYLDSESRLADTSVTDDNELVEGAHG
jgi:hypothetical protein